ncbi:MAG: hypothetical protein QHH15_03410 [Candidatus Thermoplasmatota archaeon]|nr:hypothetical protein [Candidatus Thermoplasmatota archaeon]
MNKKILINLIVVLLLVTSTFSVLGDTQEAKKCEQSCPPEGTINFGKKVWKDDHWDNYVTNVEIGTILRFNISLTYHKNSQNSYNWKLSNIVVTDYLPECLLFAGNVTFYNAPTIVEQQNNGTIIWNFTDYCLSNAVTMSIEFDAIVVECQETENENIADVSAVEGNFYNHYDQDFVLIIIATISDPVLSYWPNYCDFGEQEQGWTGSSIFEIWNSGEQTLNYSLTEELNWIEINPTSGSSTGEHDTINVNVVNTENLHGYLSGDIIISSNGGDGVVHVCIYLHKKGPILSYSVTDFNFGEHERGWIGNTTFEIWNSGEQTLNYIISEDLSWIEINPTSGSSTGEHDTINVNVVNTSSLTGYNYGYISINSNGGSGKIYLHIYIYPPAPPAQLKLSIKKGFSLGKVCAVIENIGEVDAHNINWEFNITAGVLRKKPIQNNGTIDLIEINKNKQICSGRIFGKSAIKLRFGRIKGYVQASVEDYTTKIEFSGFITGRAIIVLRSKSA